MLRNIPGIRRFCDTVQDTPQFVTNKWTWIVRRFFLRWTTIPVIIKHQNGAKFHLGQDRLVDQILWDLEGPYHDLFYPPDMVVPSGGLILDLGAHHGVYFALTCQKFPATYVIAVEPDPVAVLACKNHIKLNHLADRVELHECAIAQEEGEGWLEQSEEGSWGNRLVSTNETRQPKSKVQLATLKSVLQERHPYLVKCNCEGGEFAAIPALLKLGLRPRYIVLLVHPEEGDIAGLLDELRQCEYEITPVATSESHPRFVCRHCEKPSSSD